MSDTGQSLVYSDFILSRLESDKPSSVLIGLLSLYTVQFLQVYLSPILTKTFSIIFRIILPRKVHSLGHREEHDKVIGVDEGSTVSPATQVYQSFQDDRKSKKGTENDIYMLRTHGYKKLRFVSKSFIKRNKLSMDASSQEPDTKR